MPDTVRAGRVLRACPQHGPLLNVDCFDRNGCGACLADPERNAGQNNRESPSNSRKLDAYVPCPKTNLLAEASRSERIVGNLPWDFLGFARHPLAISQPSRIGLLGRAFSRT
jgi:hypothetical protein